MTTMLFLLTSVLLQSGNQITEGPWGGLGVAGLLLGGMTVIWRLNTKLATQNEKLHNRIAEIQEQRAMDGKVETKAMTEALIASTSAMKSMTVAVENNNRLLERLINEKGNESA